MEKARVLLLNPPTAPASTEVLLNLAYLAASLRAAGHEARIIDATAPYRPWDAGTIAEAVTEFKPHFIGVTLTISFIPQTYGYLKELRKMNVPIVAGGPHANALPEEVLGRGVDIVAIGEGEETILDLARYFLGKTDLENIKGICFKDKNGAALYTPPRMLIKDLDSIPFPDFGDFPIKNYTGSSDVNSNPIFWSVFSSRGCPFDCVFCSSHNVFGRTIRLRSARNVFEEMKSLHHRFGVDKITFQDDEILCSKARFMELADLINDSGLKFKISIRTRVDSIDNDILKSALRAGITRISFGLESWDDDTLKKINKKYTTRIIRENFKLLEDTEFPHISFNNIVGWPWETEKHFRQNVAEIKNIPASIKFYTWIGTPIPYPKTRLYEMYHKEYGFTDWWLDPDKHKPPAVSHNPFFLNFAGRLHALYIEDRFWKYAPASRKRVIDFSWKVFSIFIRRHYRFQAAAAIIILCRFSYFLWRLDPGFEGALFSRLSRSRILKDLKNEVIFTKKY